MIILLYHNVLEHRPSAFNMLARPDWVTVAEFEEEIASLADRFEFVSVDAIAAAVREGRRIPRACAITFDDGYLGAYKYGLPILEQYGATAAYYVITQHLSGDQAKVYDFFDKLEARLWMTKADALDLTEFGGELLPLRCDACKVDALKKVSALSKAVHESQQVRLSGALAEQLVADQEGVQEYLSHEAFQPMTWDDLVDIRRRGSEVGSHSRSHRALSQLDEKTLDCEIRGSHEDLASHVDADGIGIAYPFGQQEHYSPNVVAAAREAGYAYALTATTGINHEQTPLFELRRSTFRELKKLRKEV
jgi:peptidoglycan/xylan/chitin deacetylase (PgdA/CDA1 family)